MAHGPSFKEKTEIEPFENIEVYNLICGKFFYVNLTVNCGYNLKIYIYFETGDKSDPRDGCYALY